jgi:hypothetical protein
MRSRILILLAVLVLSGLLIALFEFRRAENAGTAALPGLFTAAPSGGVFFLYADLVAIRHSEFFSRAMELLGPAPREDADYREFVRQAGFDYARDLDRLLLTGHTRENTGVITILAAGRMDRARLLGYLKSAKIPPEFAAPGDNSPQKLAGFTIARTGPPRPDVPRADPSSGGVWTLAFLGAEEFALSDDPLLAGEAGGAKKLAAQVRRQRGAPRPPEFDQRVARLSGSAVFVLWKPRDLRAQLKSAGLESPQLAALAQKIRWLGAGARADGAQLKIAVDAECDTPDDAAALAREMSTLSLLGRLLLDDRKLQQRLGPQLLALARKLLRDARIRADGNRVRLNFQVTAEELFGEAQPAPGPKKQAGHPGEGNSPSRASRKN